MNKKLICFLLMAIITMICTFTGCGSTNLKINIYNEDVEKSSVSTQTIAENSNFKLNWDDDKKCILLENVKNGKVWSNIPYEYYLEDGSSANVNSTINITVVDSKTLQQTTMRGYTEAVKNGFVLSEKIKDGIKITYYFSGYNISIPVEYTLSEDSLKVSVNFAEIKESTKYLLLNVSLAPFLCSAQNSSGNGYLFVPCGSGALMYANENAELERVYTGEVYGEDLSRPNPESIADDESICLPVFGAKDKDSALLGILEEGAESAVIEAYSGNSRTGYSNIYPTFYTRGYDIYDRATYSSLKDDLIRVSEAMSKHKITVGYYPLSGGDADYNGMAKRYRKYLNDKKMLSESDTQSSPYSVTMLGGVLTSSSVLGIPSKKLNTMTTFSDAYSILNELKADTGITPTVLLKGFGSSGIDIGEIAGGYKIPSQFGSDKERTKLNDYCKENNIPNYFDFDIVRYNESGSGFSYSSDCAKTAIMKTSDNYEVIGPLRNSDEDKVYRLLGRNNLTGAMNKLTKLADKEDIKGISLMTLGNISYSDYSSDATFTKGNTEKDVSKIIGNAKKSGYNVATGANAYAAMGADTVFDCPTDNGDYNCFDARIPFYQIVFSGEKQLYSKAVNLAVDPQELIMRSAIGGMGLGFTLTGSYDISFTESQIEKLYGTLYKDNKDLIKNTINDYSKFFDTVKGQKIDKYEIISKELSKTVFENGVALYANHSQKEIESPAGSLKAYEYKYSK